LSALIPEAPPPRPRTAEYFLCPIEQIAPQKGQPRRYFDEQRLAELVASIKQQGLVQPLLVRPDGDSRYTLIAGERRWRAAQKAGIHEVPVVVREVSDLAAFEIALVENLQREDLNPIEEAEAYARLLDEHSYTQERLADKIGKERSTVANSLRLLKLPENGKRALVAGAISSGHARALLGIGSNGDAALFERALKQVVGRGLSVRQTEALVRRLRAVAPREAARPLSPNARDLQERLCRQLGMRVKLHPKQSGGGRVEISYGSLDELDRLLEVLLR
jgi:ParB family chromosome partitioning protein